MANIQKGDSLASDSVTECYVGTVTHFRNERNPNPGDKNPNAGDKQVEQVSTCLKQNGNVAITNPPTATEHAEKKEDVVVTVPAPALTATNPNASKKSKDKYFLI